MIEVCPTCEGTGLKPSRGAVNWGLEWKCDVCEGRGWLIPEELESELAEIAAVAISTEVVGALREALAKQPEVAVDLAYAVNDAVLSRLLEGAETIQWCETHRAEARFEGKSKCIYTDCEVVDRQLLPARNTVAKTPSQDS